MTWTFQTIYKLNVTVSKIPRVASLKNKKDRKQNAGCRMTYQTFRYPRAVGMYELGRVREGGASHKHKEKLSSSCPVTNLLINL